MIDLTPLDVRNKRGDFKKLMRGYDPQEVDIFLELVAERLEALVRENLQFRERTQTLQDQVNASAGREQAVQDALVTAQELRADIRNQSQREADHILKEAEAEARRLVSDAEAEARRVLAEADAEVRNRLRGIERQLDLGKDTIQELERRRERFLKDFRTLLERELDAVQVEASRAPFEERAIDLDLGAVRSEAIEAPVDDQPADVDDGVEESDFEEDAGAEEPEVSDVASSDEELAPEEDVEEVSAADTEVDVEAVDTTDPVEDESVDGEVEVAEAEAALADAVAEEPVDVADLQPDEAARPSAPPADVGDGPTSLELELMAGAAAERGDPDQFAGVPDLETVLAEAGIEEVVPPASDEIAPPPAPGRGDDHILIFEPEEDGKT